MSEAAPATIRRAAKVHKISALQTDILYGHAIPKMKFWIYVKNWELHCCIFADGERIPYRQIQKYE